MNGSHEGSTDSSDTTGGVTALAASEGAPVTRALARASGPFELPAVTYRLLGSKGFRSDEAGNLTAYLQGLTPVKGGWAVGEIERLLFVRHLVERGDLRS
jgi:hypothetical protein